MSSPSSTPPPPPPPPPEQHSGFDLTAISVRKPVLAWMIMAAAILFGGVAASRIGISQFPDVDFPTISVNVAWEGASPEVIESDVVEPIEESLTQIEGIKSISSVARCRHCCCRCGTPSWVKDSSPPCGPYLPAATSPWSGRFSRT